jgi:hypothetical protein
MICKALEVRDEATFIPVLCVDMNPTDLTDKLGPNGAEYAGRIYEAQRYLLRRCGYPCDGDPNILMTRLSGDGHATNDPYGWKDGCRTFPVAHKWIIDNWSSLSDGDVVDVQFILGETKVKKLSERGV